jgi:signal transduction histidine kinase
MLAPDWTRMPTNVSGKPSVSEYAFALGTSVLAGVLTSQVGPVMGSASFFGFFHMAVVLSAFYGGLGPGILAATTSFLILDCFFIPPLNAFALGPHLFQLVLFGVVAVVTSLLSGKLKKGKRELQLAHDELEERIRLRTDELSQANRRLVDEVAQRREAERTILDVSAREQRRLGQDLHDGLCQTLAGVRLMVEDLREKAGGGSRDLEVIEAQLTQALDQAYTISRGLYPVELETNGLMSALEELAAKISTIHPVRCRFRCPRPVPIHDIAVATHLYRIAQEAVVNGIKGGKASLVHLTLLDRGARAVLSIADNGTGLGNGPVRKGMGLKIMEHRARMIDAELRLRSRPKGGTVVTCSFPAGRRPGGGSDAG